MVVNGQFRINLLLIMNPNQITAKLIRNYHRTCSNKMSMCFVPYYDNMPTVRLPHNTKKTFSRKRFSRPCSVKDVAMYVYTKHLLPLNNTNTNKNSNFTYIVHDLMMPVSIFHLPDQSTHRFDSMAV